MPPRKFVSAARIMDPEAAAKIAKTLPDGKPFVTVNLGKADPLTGSERRLGPALDFVRDAARKANARYLYFPRSGTTRKRRLRGNRKMMTWLRARGYSLASIAELFGSSIWIVWTTTRNVEVGSEPRPKYKRSEKEVAGVERLIHVAKAQGKDLSEEDIRETQPIYRIRDVGAAMLNLRDEYDK